MSTAIKLNEDLSVDLAYGDPRDGLVLEQHLAPDLAMQCHGTLLYLAAHPWCPDAYELVSAELCAPRVCMEPLSPADAGRFYRKLLALL
jgi:hypothetical protein